MSRHHEPATHPTQLCGPDCRYRLLYEGSQRSLTDLAARQADALGRLGRLRQAVARSLKRFFPTEFAEAERGLDQRMSDLDPDLLAAYLESFLQMATSKAPASGSDIARLRAGLVELGVNVKGSFTVSDLATAIERHATQPVTRDLSSLFIAEPWKSSPEPTSRPLTPRTAPIEPSPAPTDLELAPEPTIEDISGPFEGYEDQIGNYEDQYYTTKPDEVLQVPARAPQEPIPDGSVPDVAQPAPEPHVEPSEGTVEGSSTLTGGLDDLFSVTTPMVPTPRRSRTKPDTIAGPWAAAPATPIKPQTLPTPTKARARTTKRAVRTTATLPQTPSAALSEDVRNQLLAAVCVTRPVFTADLVDLIKSAEVVAAWEDEWSGSSDLAIRFIPPKPRHKLRGALIFPQEYLRNATPEFKNSLWARVLLQYKGAKAYELGVLLHRFNEDVVSYNLGPHVATFRLARPQGLVGLAVVLDASLGAGGNTRTALSEALEVLMHERLVQIAVLTTNAEILDSISEVVTEEAQTRQWLPTAPITLSKSWDYAAGTGVALPLLGV